MAFLTTSNDLPSVDLVLWLGPRALSSVALWSGVATKIFYSIPDPFDPPTPPHLPLPPVFPLPHCPRNIIVDH